MRLTETRLSLALIVGLAAVTLTGCAGPASPSDAGTDSSPSATSSDETEEPSSITPTPSAPSATATPTSAATAPAGPVITTAGYGDLKLGRPVPSTTKLVEWRQKQCYDGRWTTPGVTDVKKDPITVRTDGNTKTGKIVFIVVNDESVMTKSGAHIGTSLDDLTKLFPDATSKKLVDDTIVTVKDSAGQVQFEVHANDDSGAKVASYVAGISVFPADAKPALTLHGDGFGPCYGA